MPEWLPLMCSTIATRVSWGDQLIRMSCCMGGTGLAAEVSQAWKTLQEQEGLVPYLDYATPTFYDDVSGQIQRLLAGRVKPDAFTKTVEQDYTKFTGTL